MNTLTQQPPAANERPAQQNPPLGLIAGVLLVVWAASQGLPKFDLPSLPRFDGLESLRGLLEGGDGPRGELRELVEPIGEALEDDRQKRDKIAAYYRAFAATVERDSGEVITSTGRFEGAHEGLLKLLIAGRPELEEPRVNVLIDRAIATHVGILLREEGGQVKFQPVDLDGAKREKLVEVLEAIAWSCGG